MLNLSSSAVQARSCTNDASPEIAAGDARMKAANVSECSADLDKLVRNFILSMLGTGILTRQELARRAGLSRSGLSQWLHGRRTMKLENASRLISLFSLERFIHWLIRHGQDPAQQDGQPDLLTLLEQVSVVLGKLLEEKLEVHLDEAKKKCGKTAETRQGTEPQGGPGDVESPRSHSARQNLSLNRKDRV